MLNSFMLRRSELAETLRAARQALTIRNMKESLGFVNPNEAEFQVKAKICAVDAFMEGIEGHLSQDKDSRAASLLTAQRLYEKAMKHIDSIGIERIDEVRKGEFIKFIDRHRSIVSAQLRDMDEKRVKEILADMEENGNNHNGHTNKIPRHFLRAQIRKKRIEAYKYAVLGVGAYTLAAAGFMAGAHFEHASDAFVAFGGGMLAGGTSVFLKSRAQFGHIKVLERVFEERYG